MRGDERVRETMGLRNVILDDSVLPADRRSARVISRMAERFGRGKNGLEIYVMSEIPNNVLADRRVRRALRRIFHRLQRPDAAGTRRGSRFGAESPSNSRNATQGC